MRTKRVRRAAFTLAEIMVVIVLIAVLAAFLLPAVLSSQKAGRISACKAEIQSLALAIDNFYADFGFYPPTSRAFNPATGNFDGVAFGDYGYSEALVHCLANRFTKGAGDASIQGSDRLIGGAPVNSGPYFEVKMGDLTDIDNDGWPELPDKWGNPYIYIPPDDYFDIAGTAYNAGALVRTTAGLDVSGNPDPTLLTTDTPPLNNHYQRFKYQLISRGPDGWTPGIDPRDADADGWPDGYRDISITGNPYGSPPSATAFNPALVGTDTDLAAPYVFAPWGHTEETADDINNW